MSEDQQGARVYLALILVAVSFGRKPWLSIHRLELPTLGIGVWV